MSARLAGTELLSALEQGRVRVAERGADGAWTVNAWVKEEILALFRASPLAESSAGTLTFVDKRDIPPRTFSLADKVRIVPGGSSVRRGACLAPGVIVMPPAYINVGAFVDEGSMRRVLNLSFRRASESDATGELWALLGGVGLRNDVLAVPRPDSSTLAREWVWGRLQALPLIGNRSLDLYEARFEIRERK